MPAKKRPAPVRAIVVGDELRALPGHRLPERPAVVKREQPPDLRDAVAAAIEDMPWLTDADKAAVALAHRLAVGIETAVERAEAYESLRSDIDSQLVMKRLEKLEAQCDVAKAVGYLGQQLQTVLRDLYGTPASRKDMKVDKPVGGRLAQLRAAAGSAG